MFRSTDLGINGRFSSWRCLNYGNLYLAINTEEEAKITITAFSDAGVCVGHQRDNEDETFLADGFLVSVIPSGRSLTIILVCLLIEKGALNFQSATISYANQRVCCCCCQYIFHCNRELIL